jgi:hypothetical protein
MAEAVTKERTAIAVSSVIKIEARSRTAKSCNRLNDIRSILKINITRDAHLHLRNLVDNLFLLFLNARGRSFLCWLGSSLAVSADKSLQKIGKTSELLNTILEVCPEHRDTLVAFRTSNLRGRKFAVLVEVL